MTGGQGKKRLERKSDEALRRRYEGSDDPVGKLCREFGISRQRLYRLARKQGWRMRRGRRPDADAQTDMGDALLQIEAAADDRSDPDQRAEMIARLYGACRRQIDDIEARYAEQPLKPADSDDARRLSELVQTLHKLNELDTSTKAAAKSDGEGDTDIEGLRAELARRMARLRGDKPE